MENDSQDNLKDSPEEKSVSNLENTIEETGGDNKLLIIIAVILSILLVIGGIIFSVSYFSNPKGEVADKSGTGLVLNTCDVEYENLLSPVKLDDSLCGQGDFRSGEFKDAEIKKSKTNIVMIFDSSGSMAAKIDGKSKMDIAKNATNKFVEGIKDSEVNLSMVVYGHKGSNSANDKAVSCAGIEEVYWFGPVDPTVIKTKFNNLNPTGWTPIASSLEKAKNILVEKSLKGDNNIILLVSDGEETCGGNPIAVTQGIKNANLGIKVNVIGFDVGGATEDQLKKIAEAGDGQYSSVKNEKDFEMIFQQQENMVNKMDFAVKSGVEQLYDISSSVLKYNQCLMMLNVEEAGFMLNMEEKISPKCKTYVEEKYFKRYDDVSGNLKSIFENEKATFDNIVNVKK